MKDIHVILESAENAYTLDPYMTKPATNHEKREKMKKYLTTAIEVVLTDKQRQVLEMYYLNDKTIPEIADILGKHKSTIQRTLKTAVLKLQKNKIIFEKSCI